nr:malolactic enzyme [Lentilactobacillus sp. SPB1-3]MCZ0977598.1 NAD-dependent malic enzyme [Lentilactobacillus sp. SPB1-3]
MKARNVLNNPFLNKGTGFTQAERDELGLNGLIPPRIQTIEEQAERIYEQFQSKENKLAKRQLLMQVFNENRTLFFKLFSQHLEEFMPIVYDPIIAESIEEYSHQFIQPQGAIFLSVDDPDHIKSALENGANGRDIRLIVVSDAEGILGIGDWGVQGVDISVGKLMVYTAAAGIDPSQVLPVVIDAGTNRESLLDDPMYLGNRHLRIKGQKYDEFIDEFVSQTESLFPNVYLHWEDFGRSNAAKILNKYRNKITTFNDDIQGTGIIVLAGILGALQISGEKLTEQTYMSFGAGTAGAGIVKRIYDEMILQGLSEEEAKQHFYLVDKQGLLFDDDKTLTPEQKPFARNRSEFNNSNELDNLESAVMAVKPTILVGTSTVAGAFNENVVQEMTKNTKRPIIFPISNPTKLLEAQAADIIQWSKGKALVATGVPSEPVEFDGVIYKIGQANNALVYPGLALGTIAVSAHRLTDSMISAAAHSLSETIASTELGAAVLPPVSKLSEFSKTVAIAVAQDAVKKGVSDCQPSDINKRIELSQWQPEY